MEFLRDKKTEIMDIPSVMKLLFLDEALDGYNFNGIQGRKMQKRPLKMYAIFIDCMLGKYDTVLLVHWTNEVPEAVLRVERQKKYQPPHYPCFSTEAWREQMVDPPQLQKEICIAIAASKRRVRVKRCRENKQIKQRNASELQLVEVDDGDNEYRIGG